MPILYSVKLPIKSEEKSKYPMKKYTNEIYGHQSSIYTGYENICYKGMKTSISKTKERYTLKIIRIPNQKKSKKILQNHQMRGINTHLLIMDLNINSAKDTS